jgi:hypothetical protein
MVSHFHSSNVLLSSFFFFAGVAFEGIIFPAGSFQAEAGTVLSSTKRPDMSMNMKTCHDCKVKLYNTDKMGLDILAGMEYRRSYGVTDLPDRLRPGMHTYYKDRLVDMTDDLPKFADFPEAFGGSGKMLNSDGSAVAE